jgi:thiol-disulfide isomerase/thioredoxin
MKKTSFVVTSIFLVSLILFNGCKVENNKNDYLRKVLGNLENIKYASYSSINKVSAPMDTMEFRTIYDYTEEYDNPADTTLGSSFTIVSQSNGNKTSLTYDGLALSYIFWDKKTIRIDSFKTNKYPFRPIIPPFFKQTKTIIKYALETRDSISTNLQDYGDSVKFSLYIPHRIIEFIGKPYVLDNHILESKDVFSRYDIWIDKMNDLPYKFRRNLPFQTTWHTVKDVEFNKKKIEDFVASDYFPKEFAVTIKGDQRLRKNDLLGKRATDWILKDVENNSVALKDLKSKVLVIQFTGIGCGPCHASIPFIKQLLNDYKDKDFEFVSIETWSNNIEGIKRYQKNNDLNYIYLLSTDEVTSSYQVGAVPVFYILDKDRVVRKIIEGYSEGTTDKVISDAINELI